MNLWLVLIISGLTTFATRLSFILLYGKIKFPHWLEHSLRYVPPAVLSAILFPELLLHSGQLDLSLGNVRLIAGLLAILVAWRTRNVLLTIAVGMVALWIFSAIL